MTGLTDAHVHLVALPHKGNGCHVSSSMLKRLFVRVSAWSLGLDLTDPAQTNSGYLERLRSELRASQKVSRAVLLAMDGVYDDSGRLDLAQTDFLISNDYLFQVVRQNPVCFLPGASINPQRRDALDELERCIELGAVLVKVLPNAQAFDPSHPRYLPFFKALVKYGIPLLSHVGFEFSLIGKDQSCGDPAKLRPALDQGVRVIGAHACSYGLGFVEPYFKIFRQMVRDYPHFYADISALTLPNRVRTLFLLKRHPELQDRLIFGTDYPLAVFAYPSVGRGYGKVRKNVNPFDRQAAIFDAMKIRYKDFFSIGAENSIPRSR